MEHYGRNCANDFIRIFGSGRENKKDYNESKLNPLHEVFHSSLSLL